MNTSSAEFFEAKYRAKADPWEFATNEYELKRYAAITSAIAHRRYQNAFEPGCSIGVLTRRLAEHCDSVYAIDFSSSASDQAKQRCADLANVEVRCASLHDPLPSKRFDLLVLSEIGYYFDLQDWQQISYALIEAIPSGATVLAAHWLGESKDHCLSGDEVHEVLLGHPALRLEYSELHKVMRLDRMVKL